VKGLTIDSSVIISSLLEQETRHQEALKIWRGVLSGKNFAVMPYSVLVEVVAAIRRRTGSEELALEVKKALLEIDSVSFIVIDDKAAENAADLAAKSAVRGMDALVIQVAREFGTELVSFDREMMTKAALATQKAAPK
jgi:predicted nucleic acid-binding protein